jgi:hypothetical protein
MDNTNSSIGVQLINNFRFPKFFPRESIEFALNYKPEKGEKFIVAYPKSGTTWTQQIIHLIINNGIIERHREGEPIIHPLLESAGKKVLNISLKPKVIKTHMPFGLMPYNKSVKYLFILRNPKDTCASFFHHFKAHPGFEFSGYFHQFFSYWINGGTPYGDYFQHVLSFWSHRFDDNFSLLVYEHMKTNPKKAFLKIAEFLGEEFVVKMKENNEFLLNKVIENSTIDALKGSLGK